MPRAGVTLYRDGEPVQYSCYLETEAVTSPSSSKLY